MTDKECLRTAVIAFLIAGIFLGMLIGSLTTCSRYDSEIRTDQVELKEQVAEIIEDERVIQDLVQELLSQIEKIKLERKDLEDLKIRLSEGE